jgi:FMN phosphatase YigB (HAD superfamily)
MSTRADEFNQLAPKDIQNDPVMLDILADSHAVYFASVKPASLPLLSTIREHAPKAGMLVDLSRAGGVDGDLSASLARLLEIMQSAVGEPSGKATFEAILLPADMEANLFEAAAMAKLKGRDLDALSRDLATPIILYGEPNTVKVIQPGPKPPIELSLPGLDFGMPNIQERFKAGVVLAWSAAQALSRVLDTKQYNGADAMSSPLALWGGSAKENLWHYCIGFGLAVANAEVMVGDGYATLATVLAQGRAKPISRAFDPTIAIVTKQSRWGDPRCYRLPKDITAVAATLSDLRRLGSFTFTRPPFQCSSAEASGAETPCGRETCWHKRHVSSKAAILIDLDSTLLDSTRLRELALRPAMNKLLAIQQGDSVNTTPASREVTIDCMVADFHEKVYDRWALFKMLGLGDYRQEWNERGWYIAYLLFRLNADLDAEVAKWAKEQKVALHDLAAVSLQWARCGHAKARCTWPDWAEILHAKFQEVSTEYADQVREAQHEFSNAQLYAFREAHDFLQTLERSGQFNLYIVSEGHHATQVMKLERTGLLRYFKPGQILTTSAAADAREVMTELEQATRILQDSMATLHDSEALIQAVQRRDLDWLNEAYRIIPAGGPIRAKVARLISESEAKSAAEFDVCRTQQQLTEARIAVITKVREIIARMAEKGDVSFYAAAIRSILRNQERPLNLLSSFHTLMEPVHQQMNEGTAMKLAMVGDKPSGDIAPPNRLLGANHLLSIRLLAGKYLKREPPHDQQGVSQPTYSVDTLAQAKMLLLSSNVWDQILCTDACDVFYHEILTPDGKDMHTAPEDHDRPTVELRHIVLGLEMTDEPEFGVVRKVCAGVLSECLRRAKRDRWKHLIDSCLLQDLVDEDSGAESLGRARRTALVVGAVAAFGGLLRPDGVALAEGWVLALRKSFSLLLQHLSSDRDKVVPAIQEAVRGFVCIKRQDNDGVVARIAQDALDDIRNRMSRTPALREIIGDILK